MYVIYCQSGKEMTVVRQLAEKNITAYAPRRLVQERHRRRWVQREVLLFSQTEEEYIRFLCNDGHALGISRGYVSGGALHIMDGFLKRFQHKIIRFNRRGKRAVADVTIYGRHYEVILGCEIESQPVVPLISSGTAKNIP